MTEPSVQAAGGLVRRWREGREEILLVHRPKYDDWSFPKGKLDPGESWEHAAIREVFEEADVVALLGDEAAQIAYVDHRGRDKTVRYWQMTVAVELDFEADDEVDQRRWVDRTTAMELLSYDHDRDVLASLPAGSKRLETP